MFYRTFYDVLLACACDLVTLLMYLFEDARQCLRIFQVAQEGLPGENRQILGTEFLYEFYFLFNY